MTDDEVYGEIDRDCENLTRWWYRQLPGMRRRALKARTLPCGVFHEYTSPRRVSYVIYTLINDRHLKKSFTGVMALRRVSGGLMAYQSRLSHHTDVSKAVYTPHMWRRYAERTGTQLTGVALVRRFMERNHYGETTNDVMSFARSVRYNGEDHMASCVTDGVLLGHIVNDMFVVRTFITYDMTTGRQQTEFTQCRDQIGDLREIERRLITERIIREL